MTQKNNKEWFFSTNTQTVKVVGPEPEHPNTLISIAANFALPDLPEDGLVVGDYTIYKVNDDDTSTEKESAQPKPTKK